MGFICFLFCFLFVGFGSADDIIYHYNQIFVDRFTFASFPLANFGNLPFDSIVDCSDCGKGVACLSSNGSLFFGDFSSWRKQDLSYKSGDVLQKVVCDNAGNMVVASELGVYTVNSVNFASFPQPVMVNDVANFGNVLFIGTSSGLFEMNLAQPTVLNQVSLSSLGLNSTLENVNSVAVNSEGVVAAGTDLCLWRSLSAYTGPSSTDWHFFRVPGIIDDTPKGLAFSSDGNICDLFSKSLMIKSNIIGSLWIANSVCISRQSADLTFERFAGHQGVAVSNLTSASCINNECWFGSLSGLVHYLGDGQWTYYLGPRFLPSSTTTENQTIVSLTSFNGTMVAVTGGGISRFSYKNITLEEKAAIFEETMVRHRTTTPGTNLPDGAYVTGDCQLTGFGNTSSFVPRTNDNNGLWTSIYVLSQCFKYAVTKDPQVKANGWAYFKGLVMLTRMTGIKGLPARSVYFGGNPDPNSSKQWRKSPTYPGWWWESDTSSDEITGHLMVYRMVYDLLAETESEKQQAQEIFLEILQYIVLNNYQLIDWTGNATTWGRWNPEQLNLVDSWFDQKGVNAMQILGYIRSGLSFPIDENLRTLFTVSYNYLAVKNQYNLNIVNAKITLPSDDNYSDDELTFLPYLTWIWAERQSPNVTFKVPLKPFFDKSIERTWRIVSDYNPTLWALITFLHDPSLISEQVINKNIETLKQWPMDHINWPIDNSKRLDVIFSKDVGRMGSSFESFTLLPRNQLDCPRYNCDPFNLSPQGDGKSESDPGAFLSSYWMMRWVDKNILKNK